MERERIGIRETSYSRNGVSGEGFVACDFYLIHEDGKKENLIATWRVVEGPEENLNLIESASCRVIDPKNLDNHYRGDVLAVMLQKEIDRNNGVIR